MGKKVFITGISGQDGSYMIDYLLEKEKDIQIFGGIRRLSVENHDNFAHVDDPRFQTVDFDLTDPYIIQKGIQEIQPDYFINFAASSFVGSSWDNPVLTMEVNTMGVLHILESLRKFSPKTRFYNAGSSEEWGNVVSVPQDENHPLRPRSPYGASKASARHLVKVYRESYGMYAIQGFLLNHESERRGSHFVTRKITKNVARISKAYGQAKPFESLKLGNVNSQRDWSHALDFVDGIWKMLNHNIPKEYVLSSNETHTIKEFVEKSFAVSKIEGRWKGWGLGEKYVEIHDGNVLVEIDPKFYRPAEVDLLLGDSTKAREELGWEPKVSFDELVKRMSIHDILNT